MMRRTTTVLALSAALLGAVTLASSPAAHAAPAPGPQPECMQLGTMIQCMGAGGMSQTTGSLTQAIGTTTSTAPAAFPSFAPMAPMAPMAPFTLQSSETMPTLPSDVPLAIGVARGEGGTYHVGEILNVAYAVNQALTIRVIALQDGTDPITLVEGSGDGTRGQVSAVAGPAAGTQTFKIVGLGADGAVVEAKVAITVAP